jgi:hypothetical protein
MTVRIPQKNILDKVLKLFEKKREVILPEESGEIYISKGPYVQIQARREGSWKALLKKS